MLDARGTNGVNTLREKDPEAIIMVGEVLSHSKQDQALMPHLLWLSLDFWKFKTTVEKAISASSLLTF